MKRFFLLTAAVLCCAAYAKVTLSGIFSDHAVLQRSGATAIFGKASPGEKVSVSYGKISGSAVAGKDGKWIVRLDLSKCGDESRELIVKGTNTLKVKDVIVGEVWYCIGQSNMAWTAGASLDGKKHVANSANNRIRHFRMHSLAPEKPIDRIPGRWVVASPETTGSFTAAGYFFARKVNKETGLAVGLINPSWGGSSIESWINSEKLLKESTPEVAASARKELDAYFSYDKRCDDYTAKLREWLKKTGHDVNEKTVMPPADAKWTKAANIQHNVKGRAIIWFRKEINVSAKDLRGGKLYFTFGRPQFPVEVYLDGKKVADLDLRTAVPGTQFTLFNIPAKQGKRTVLLRAYGYQEKIAFPRTHIIGKQNNTQYNWEMFRQKEFPALNAAQIKAMPKHPGTKIYASKTPGMIWNGLVYPLIPMTMRGALWYQGEQNAGRQRFLYGDQIKLLVSELRKSFGKDLRFYAAQLPNFFAKNANPNFTGSWVDIRAGQNRIMNTPGVAQAIIIDLGEAGDIHPINKVPVGERLAAIALRNDYGKKVPCYSPEAVKAVRKDSTVTVTFKHTDGGLCAQKLPEFYWIKRSANKKAPLVRNSPKAQVEGFALCGKNGRWYWADKAEIKGNTVIVSSAKVKEPAAVRYAWQINPTCNLYNGAGFPAAPFEIKLK
ncbi:MAG: hypothetical protein IKC65_05335 [Lentisphaeria bacterium]|nr:hypothetical protein [Lentisphaeria bacterium]